MPASTLLRAIPPNTPKTPHNEPNHASGIVNAIDLIIIIFKELIGN